MALAVILIMRTIHIGIAPGVHWYSPCYTVVYYKNPVVYYKPLRNNSNLTGYNNRNYNNYNMPLQNGSRSKSYTNSSMTANGRKILTTIQIRIIQIQTCSHIQQ